MVLGAVLRFSVKVSLDVPRHVMLGDGRIRAIRTFVDFTRVVFHVTYILAFNCESIAANFTSNQGVFFVGTIIVHFRQVSGLVNLQVALAAGKWRML